MRWITISKAMQLTAYSRQTIYNRIKSGDVRRKHYNGRALVRRADILRIMPGPWWNKLGL